MSALARLPVDGLALLAAGGGDGFPAAADLTSPRGVLLNPIKLGADGTAGDLHCCKYG